MKYGEYNVINKIGEGGFGEVFKVEKNGQYFALKICSKGDEDELKRFNRESRLMDFIKHDNVINILDSDLTHKPPFFVMPLCDGSLIGKDYQKNVELLVSDLLQVCDGLEALHNNENPILHRDINPRNILVDNGILKLSDLGLGKFENRDSTTITKFGLGTHGYAPPEFYQDGGMKNAKIPSDIFQLGKTIYALFTGENPTFLDKNKIPNGLYFIIKKCTNDNPNDRYQNVAELRDALTKHVDVLTGKNNPYKAFDNLLNEYIKSGATNEKSFNLFSSLYEFKDDADVFYSNAKKIPINYFGLLNDGDLQTFVEIYSDVVFYLNSNGKFSWKDAETIANQMKKVFDSTENIEIRTYSLKIALIFAATFNRFDAMDTFNKMLTKIKSDEEAASVMAMLFDNFTEYESIVLQKDQATDIHAMIMAVRHAVLDKNK